MSNENLQCPSCNSPLEVIARGKQKRLLGCVRCGGPGNPQLWFQPTNLLAALRKLDQGPLVEATSKVSSIAGNEKMKRVKEKNDEN